MKGNIRNSKKEKYSHRNLKLNTCIKHQVQNTKRGLRKVELEDMVQIE